MNVFASPTKSFRAAFLPIGGNVMYTATKAFQNTFTQTLAYELKGSGVQLQALCPGFTYSEFHDVAGMDRNTIPRHLWMSAQSVVDASMHGLERNKLFVVPGWKYRIFTAMLPWIPRPLRHLMALKYGASRQKHSSLH